ncbi:hypothetical protein TNCV_2422351 [Trichonephila clavipes]|nr:hypothetical protein TNCV_2422351 [Trichonephila clavipes]
MVRPSDSRPEGLGSMPVPPNTLREHTEYMLVKSVGPKSCGLNHECKGLENISLPFSSLPKLWRGDRWCCHLSFLQEFHRDNSYCHLYGAQSQG